jgi:hypothetical protein
MVGTRRGWWPRCFAHARSTGLPCLMMCAADQDGRPKKRCRLHGGSRRFPGRDHAPSGGVPRMMGTQPKRESAHSRIRLTARDKISQVVCKNRRVVRVVCLMGPILQFRFGSHLQNLKFMGPINQWVPFSLWVPSNGSHQIIWVPYRVPSN